MSSHGVYLDVAGPLLILGGGEEPQYWSAKGNLLVPVRNIDGALLAAQSIAPNGLKSFPRGAMLAGGHHVIGEVAASDRLLIAEGYATGATRSTKRLGYPWRSPSTPANRGRRHSIPEAVIGRP